MYINRGTSGLDVCLGPVPDRTSVGFRVSWCYWYKGKCAWLMDFILYTPILDSIIIMIWRWETVSWSIHPQVGPAHWFHLVHRCVFPSVCRQNPDRSLTSLACEGSTTIWCTCHSWSGVLCIFLLEIPKFDVLSIFIYFHNFATLNFCPCVWAVDVDFLVETLNLKFGVCHNCKFIYLKFWNCEFDFVFAKAVWDCFCQSKWLCEK